MTSGAPGGRRRAARRLAPALLAAIGLGACAATTYDASVTTTPAADTTSTTLPSGPISTLLPALVTEVSGLSARIVDGRDSDATLERIEALWTAAREQVATDHPDLVTGFDRSIALCRSAVTRHRPADADKAAQNIATLIATVDGRSA